MDQAIISGGIVALLAFLAAYMRDERKTAREVSRRDKAVMATLKEEIRACIHLVENDQALVDAELRRIGAGRSITNPIDPVPSQFWGMVTHHLPSALIENPDALAGIRDVTRRCDQVNAMISSRESFRAANRALSNFDDVMRGYGSLLDTFMRELRQALWELLADLETLAPVPRPVWFNRRTARFYDWLWRPW